MSKSANSTRVLKTHAQAVYVAASQGQLSLHKAKAADYWLGGPILGGEGLYQH